MKNLKLFALALSINILSLLLFICFYPLKLVVQVIVQIFCKDLGSIIPASHAQYATISPGKPISNIVLSIVLDGELTVDRVRSLFRERIEIRGSSGGQSDVYTPLTRSWQFVWGYAFWRRDTNFRVENHVRNYDYTSASLTLPKDRPCDETDLEAILGQLTHEGWDSIRSPWELLLINGYSHHRLSDTTRHYQSVLIFRTDHVLMDAYSMLKVLKTLFACDIPTPLPGSRHSSSKWRLLPFLCSLNFLTECTKAVIKGLDTSHGFGHSLPVPRANVICSIASPVPVDSIKAIKRYHNVSFVAVVQAGFVGAIQKMMTAHGLPLPDYLVSTLVLYRPNRPGSLAVHFSDVIVRWPMNCKGRVERLSKIDQIIQEEMRNMGCLGLDIFYQNLLQQMPCPIKNKLLDVSFPGISLETGIFPTLTGENVYLDGHRCLDAVGSFSILPSQGFSVSMTGCRGMLRVTFLYDAILFPCQDNGKSLGIYFQEEIQMLNNGICNGNKLE